MKIFECYLGHEQEPHLGWKGKEERRSWRGGGRRDGEGKGNKRVNDITEVIRTAQS